VHNWLRSLAWSMAAQEVDLTWLFDHGLDQHIARLILIKLWSSTLGFVLSAAMAPNMSIRWHAPCCPAVVQLMCCCSAAVLLLLCCCYGTDGFLAAGDVKLDVSFHPTAVNPTSVWGRAAALQAGNLWVSCRRRCCWRSHSCCCQRRQQPAADAHWGLCGH